MISPARPSGLAGLASRENGETTYRGKERSHAKGTVVSARADGRLSYCVPASAGRGRSKHPRGEPLQARVHASPQPVQRCCGLVFGRESLQQRTPTVPADMPRCQGPAPIAHFEGGPEDASGLRTRAPSPPAAPSAGGATPAPDSKAHGPVDVAWADVIQDLAAGGDGDRASGEALHRTGLRSRGVAAARTTRWSSRLTPRWSGRKLAPERGEARCSTTPENRRAARRIPGLSGLSTPDP